MGKSRYTFISGIAFLTGLLFILSCDKQSDKLPGFLEGKISIGPICPVEKIPPDPDCLPTAETYKSYPVSVWTANGEKKILQLSPSLDGMFKCELTAGTYLVIVEKMGSSIGSVNLPAEITINSDQTTTLNIDIDTGIR